MRILFIGDIVGRSGRNILLDRLPKLIAEWKLDLAIVNGENAAGDHRQGEPCAGVRELSHQQQRIDLALEREKT